MNESVPTILARRRGLKPWRMLEAREQKIIRKVLFDCTEADLAAYWWKVDPAATMEWGQTPSPNMVECFNPDIAGSCNDSSEVA